MPSGDVTNFCGYGRYFLIGSYLLEIDNDNLTKGSMLKVLKDTSKKDFSEYDCFNFLTHGSKGGICGIDDGGDYT